MDGISYLEQYDKRIQVFQKSLCGSFLLEVTLERYDEIVKFFKEHENILAVLNNTFALGCRDVANEFLRAYNYNYDPLADKNINLLEVKRCMLDFYMLGVAYYVHEDILKEPLNVILTKMSAFTKKLIAKKTSLMDDVLELDSKQDDMVERYLMLKELVKKVMSE